MEGKEESHVPPALFEIFQLLLERYSPAEGFEDADLHLNTQQVFEKIQEFYPSDEYTSEDVYNFLVENNFKYDSAGDMNITWLIKTL